MAKKQFSEDVLAYFRAQGAKGGKKVAAKMTPAARKIRAIKASKAAALKRTEKKRQKADKG